MKYIILPLLIIIMSFNFCKAYPWKEYEKNSIRIFDSLWKNDAVLRFKVNREFEMHTNKNILKDTVLNLKYVVCSIFKSPNNEATYENLRSLKYDSYQFKIIVLYNNRIFSISYGITNDSSWSLGVYDYSKISEYKNLVQFLKNNFNKRLFQIALKDSEPDHSFWIEEENGKDYLFYDDYESKLFSINKEKTINFKKERWKY